MTQDNGEELPGFVVFPKMADTCGQVLLGSGLTVLSHPLMYIKVLIQVRGDGFLLEDVTSPAAALVIVWQPYPGQVGVEQGTVKLH